VRLILVGSSRNAADEARIATLRDAAKELGIEVRRLPPAGERCGRSTWLMYVTACCLLGGTAAAQDAVTFAVNLPFADLRQHLATAMIGIHTMRDEHFGIGVVEYMVRSPPQACARIRPRTPGRRFTA